MLPHHAPAPQSPLRIGVGIDASRYGHYAAFLRDDHQPAADELAFAESAAGYALFRQRPECIVGRHGSVHLVVRFDAMCGQKGDVIDLWESVNGLSLGEAGVARLGATNVWTGTRSGNNGTEKRNG